MTQTDIRPAEQAGATIFEKVLGWAALVLLLFHTLQVSFHYILPEIERIEETEMAAGQLLLAAALCYSLFCLARPARRGRLLHFLRAQLGYEQLFLILLPFWMLLVCRLWQRASAHPYVADYAWEIFSALLEALLLFPLARVLGQERMRRVFGAVLKAALLAFAVFCVWVLWQYLHLNFVKFPSGNKLKIEYYSMRLGCHRNTTGAIAVALTALALYFTAREAGWRKLPYALSAAVFTMIMVYSNSRTAWYVSLLLAFTVAFLAVWYRTEVLPLWARLLLGAAAAALAALMLHWARIGIFAVLDAALEKGGMFMEPEPLPKVLSATVGRPAAELRPLAGDPRRSLDTGFSGRLELYRACLYMLFHDRLCFFPGVTPRNVGTVVFGVCGVSRIEPHAHNYFLQMGMAYGVPAMLASMVFMALVVWYGLRVLRHQRQLPQGSWMIAITVFTLLALNMLEISLLKGVTVIPVIFFGFAGWLRELSRQAVRGPRGRADTDRHRVNIPVR